MNPDELEAENVLLEQIIDALESDIQRIGTRTGRQKLTFRLTVAPIVGGVDRNERELED